MPPTSVVFMIPGRLVDALESTALSEGKTVAELVEAAMSPERAPYLVPQGVRLLCACGRKHCVCASKRDRLTEFDLLAPPRAGTLCASCTRTILEGSGFGAPLGHNDAMVTICAACAHEGTRSGAYTFGGGTDRTQTPQESRTRTPGRHSNGGH